jgi:hypothetical protein
VNQAVRLSAVAHDTEDGPTMGKGITWASSIDGVLGNGDHVTVDKLSPGQHTISVTVVDSAGQKATTSITIFVVEEAMSVHRPDVKGNPEDGVGQPAPK